MKTIQFALFPLILFLLFNSCTKSTRLEVNIPHLENKGPIITKSDKDAAVWDNQLGMYIFPYEDRYSLAVFQAAYNKLYQDSLLVNSCSELKLKPTHKALVIQPRDEAQQRMIERNEQLMVRYIPFGYEGFNSFTEITPDCHVEDDCDDYSTDTESHYSCEIPKQYVYWPVTLDIPSSINYKEEYEVFIPGYSNRSGNDLPNSVLSVLENEVLQTSSNRTGYRSCNLSVWDNLLNDYVPLSGTRIEIHPAVTYTDTTDVNGNFFIPANLNYGYVYAVLRTSNWVITSNYSTNAIFICLGAVGTINSSSAEVEMIQLSSTAALAAQGAAYTFYHEPQSLSSWNPRNYDQIRIAVVDTVTYGGWFHGGANPPFIQIPPGTNRKEHFFSTLHELGHYAHYNRIGRSSYLSLPCLKKWYRLIKESFASYASWHIGRNYYLSRGYVSSSNDFTGQGRQKWSFLSSDKYSPLFVDIVDNYNQYSIDPLYLYDPFYFLQGYTLVREIVDDCISFQTVSDKIHSYNAHVGGDYIDGYLNCYYYWYLTNLD